jgi:hypothetical protein
MLAARYLDYLEVDPSNVRGFIGDEIEDGSGYLSRVRAALQWDRCGDRREHFLFTPARRLLFPLRQHLAHACLRRRPWTNTVDSGAIRSQLSRQRLRQAQQSGF